jgi:uncharacterized membrane protein YoaK (UPF0700 family)
MQSFERQAQRDLLLLSMTAGSADAVGYLGLGQVFTSNMTGNVVLLGIDLGQGHLGPALRAIYVLAIFTMGLCLGAWLCRDLPEKKWSALTFRLIRWEKIALLSFGIGWFLLPDRSQAIGSFGFLGLLALAMGLQSTAMYRLSAPGVGTTAITGTLTAVASGLINLFFLAKTEVTQREASRQRVRFQLSIILLYVFGAALEGLLIVHVPRLAGSLPACAALFVAFGSASRQIS